MAVVTPTLFHLFLSLDFLMNFQIVFLRKSRPLEVLSITTNVVFNIIVPIE